jgi:ubiquinone/menaquinone biosynthesis C-methylase UbiE
MGTLHSAYQERSKVFDALSGASPWHRLYREKTEMAFERALLSLSPGPLRVLDAGGGTGLTAQWLARKGHSVLLVDEVAAMLEFAREKAKQDPFEIRLGNVADLNFIASGSFDAVICSQVLNFCPDLSLVFRELGRVLKPGGVLLTDIDNAVRWCLLEALDGHLDNAIAIARSGRDESRNIVGADYFFHRKDELVRIAESEGLRVASSWGLLYIAPYIHLFARSKDFLDPQQLCERARVFAREENFEKLRRLEAALAEMNLPDEMAGYLQLVCTRQ